jgi:cell division initiation protein
MGLTPVELRHARFGRALLGYRRREVDKLLADTIDSFEDVWRSCADLADKVEQLEGDLVRYHELESLLRQTLVSAERASHEVRDGAKRESELILGEAQAAARAITRDAQSERDRLQREATRIRALLRGALETLDETPVAEAEAA